MERRTLLIGSGATVATVLAGCSGLTGDDTGDDDPSETAGSGGSDAGDDAGDDTGDDATGDSDRKKDDKKKDDVPGFVPDFKLDGLELTYVRYDGANLEIGVTFDKRPKDFSEETIHGWVESLSKSMDRSITDEVAFAANVETIRFKIYDSWDEVVFEFFLHVEWLMAYLEHSLSLDELIAEMEIDDLEDLDDDW